MNFFQDNAKEILVGIFAILGSIVGGLFPIMADHARIRGQRTAAINKMISLMLEMRYLILIANTGGYLDSYFRKRLNLTDDSILDEERLKQIREVASITFQEIALPSSVEYKSAISEERYQELIDGISSYDPILGYFFRDKHQTILLNKRASDFTIFITRDLMKIEPNTSYKSLRDKMISFGASFDLKVINKKIIQTVIFYRPFYIFSIFWLYSRTNVDSNKVVSYIEKLLDRKNGT